MKRVVFIAGLALSATTQAAPVPQSAEISHAAGGAVASVPQTENPSQNPLALAIAKFSLRFDLRLVSATFVESVVRWECGARDALHDVAMRVSSFAANNGIAMPDLTVLTLDPMGEAALEKSSGFGWRDDPIRHTRKYHGGTDMRGKPGTPILAAGDGLVIFAGRQGGYGNVVYVDHGGGVITRYGHMRKIETAKGAAITAGQRIGQVGSTGRATGPHLHFEVRLDGHAVDPVAAMQIAELWREDPDEGRLAAFALSPELQAKAQSDIDPPGSRHNKKSESRPERKGRAKRPQNLW